MEKRRLKNEENSLISDYRPAFFKIIFADRISEQLRIPPHFVKYISEEGTQEATLKGPSGDHWPVKLFRSVNGMFLQDGWQEFLRENFLGNNEFLLFRYNGNMCFDVKIFNKNGCERTDVSSTPLCQGSVFPDGKRKRGRPRKYPVGNLDCHQPTYEKGPDQHLLHPPSNNLEGFTVEGIHRKIKTEEMNLHFLDTDSSSEEFERKNAQRNINSNEQKLPNFSIREPMAEEGRETIPNFSIRDPPAEGRATKTNFSIREPLAVEGRAIIPNLSIMKPPAEERKARIWKTFESFTSKFPYFKICLKEYSVDRVYVQPIPTSFSELHLPKSKLEIVLRNSEGKSWTVNTVLTARKTHAFVGEWRAFVRDNLLKQDDCCIFELVGKEEMQVHIFKSGMEV
ncbi:unnamed protein product [Ilex paraguariensis]|uniref:TF-B3 domain-containing protein n=1 Tax=Ilex paraguariensis TaxID=185542 RepID=A0ABC8S0Q9_9AQUA